jgi:hypothetical protein
MKKMFALILFIMIAFYSCSSVKVFVDYDQNADFSQYDTFRFVRPKRATGRRTIRNPLFNQDVMRKIRPIMEEKGLREASTEENADLLVHFYAATRNRTEFVSPTYRVGRWGRVYRTSPGRAVRYKEGTLVIDMVDRQKKALVWQGVGKGVLDRNQPAKNLTEIVARILEPFPPQ